MPLLMEIADRVAAATGSDRKAVMGRVNRLKREMQVDAEVVALVIAREDGVDVSDLVARADAEVVAKARAASASAGGRGGGRA